MSGYEGYSRAHDRAVIIEGYINWSGDDDDDDGYELAVEAAVKAARAAGHDI